MTSTVAPIKRNIKNVIKNYSEAQVKVREATSNDPWGPSSSLMSEIADMTFNVVAFSEIMQMIWKRLNDSGKNWRHVYKALNLLEYIIKTGNEKVAQQCRENIYAIQTLKDFQYHDEFKDQGFNVREKAKAIVALLKDEERLKNERTKALRTKQKFTNSYEKQNISDYHVSRSDQSASSNPNTPNFETQDEWVNIRPTNPGEEELQLQIALSLSKEEAENEQKMRKNDELRLKMALSESQTNVREPNKPFTNDQKLIDFDEKEDVSNNDPFELFKPSTSNNQQSNTDNNETSVDNLDLFALRQGPNTVVVNDYVKNASYPMKQQLPNNDTQDLFLNHNSFKAPTQQNNFDYDPWSSTSPATNSLPQSMNNNMLGVSNSQNYPQFATNNFMNMQPNSMIQSSNPFINQPSSTQATNTHSALDSLSSDIAKFSNITKTGSSTNTDSNNFFRS